MNKLLFLGMAFMLFTLNLLSQSEGRDVFKFEQNSPAIDKEEEKENPTELLAGLIIAPSAATSFGKEEAFSTGVSLFAAVAIAKGDWSLAPYYSFDFNSAGTFVTYNIIDDLGSYGVIGKSINGDIWNYSVGLTTPIGADFIQAYIEYGGTFGDEESNFLGIGAYFNLFKSVKSW